MKRNIKLYPIYTMFSYDVLFYYSISFIFLTTIKGIALAQVALLSSVYSASSIILQVPSAIIVDKIGAKKGLVIGNLLIAIWSIFLIIFNKYYIFIIGEFVCAFGFALKGVATAPFIIATLKSCGKSKDFTKMESKGSSMYFIIEASACVVAGYLYIISPYLPLVFTTAATVIAAIIALCFKATPLASSSVKEYLVDLKSSFKFIFRSSRMHALLLFCSTFAGVVMVTKQLMNAFFLDNKLSSTGFGYVFAIFAILSAIGAIIQEKVEKNHKNKTLGFLSITSIIILLLVGIAGLILNNSFALIVFGTFLFGAHALLKGAYRVIIKEYITRYAASTIRTKIMSMFYLSENFGYAIYSFLISLILSCYTTNIALILVGAILSIVEVFVLIFMRNRVGLDPNTYTTKDRSDILYEDSNN